MLIYYFLKAFLLSKKIHELIFTKYYARSEAN